MTPEQIAEKLTPAQRRAIITGAAAGCGKWPLRNALAAKGLAKAMPFRLTELGITVRSILTTTHTNRSMGE